MLLSELWPLPLYLGSTQDGLFLGQGRVVSALQMPPAGGRKEQGVRCLPREPPSDWNIEVWSPQGGAAAYDRQVCPYTTPGGTVPILQSQIQAVPRGNLSPAGHADKEDVSNEKRC